MTWVAAGVVGGAVIGGVASNAAADKQVGAAGRANDLTAGQFGQTQGNLKPWLTSGTSANDYLSTLLGIPGYESGTKMMNGQETTLDQIRGIYRNDQLNKLAQQGRPNDALDEAGINSGALNAWKGLAPGTQGGDFGQLTKPFGLDQFQESPAYQFNLAEGRKAIDKAAAARGKYYQPSTLQDIAKFSQGLASNEYQNAFNNYNTSMGNIYSRLQNASGSGQNAAATLGGFAGQAAGAMSNNIVGAGNAQASGIVGAGNAINGAGGQLYNNYVLQQILGRNQAPTYSNNPATADVGSFDFLNNQG